MTSLVCVCSYTHPSYPRPATCHSLVVAYIHPIKLELLWSQSPDFYARLLVCAIGRHPVVTFVHSCSHLLFLICSAFIQGGSAIRPNSTTSIHEQHIISTTVLLRPAWHDAISFAPSTSFESSCFAQSPFSILRLSSLLLDQIATPEKRPKPWSR